MKKKGSENKKFSGLFLLKAKKGALSIDIPIELIALVFSFAVIITLFIPPIYHWLQEKSSSGVCEWSIVAGAIARPLGKETISPACKANRINISIKDLQPHLNEAQNTIKKWISDDSYAKIREEFPTANLENEYKYALNKVVADEMNKCWTKVIRGKLPMFDKWYNKIDFFGSDYPKYAGEYVDQVNAFITIWGAPTFCIVCGNIKFNEDLKNLSLPGNIDLTKWLQHTPHSDYPSKSMYEYLYEGQTTPSDLVLPEYNYDLDPPNRYSVIYKRINPHFFDDVIENIWGFVDYLNPFVDEENNVPEAIHQLKLVPHDLVAKPYSEGGESCFYIID